MSADEPTTLNSGGNDDREQKSSLSDNSLGSGTSIDSYRGLFDTFTDCVMVLNGEGEIIYRNTSIQRHLTSNNTDDFYSLLAKEDSDLIRNNCEKILEQNKTIRCDIEIKTQSEPVYCEFVFNILSKQDKFILLIGRDVTEYKKSIFMGSIMYKITQVSNLSTNILELMQGVHNILKDYIHAKNLYLAIYNRENETISFPYFSDENYYGGVQTHAERSWGAGATEYVILRGEMVLLTKSELLDLEKEGILSIIGPLPFIWLSVPIFNKVTDVIGVITIQHYTDDVVYSQRDKEILQFVSVQIASAIERLTIEENLKKAEHEYKQLFDSNPDPLFIISSVYKNANAQALELFKCNLDQLKGKLPSDFSPKYQPDGKLSVEKQNLMIEKAVNEGFNEFTWKHKTLEGDIIDCEVRLNLIAINNEKILLAWVRDTTEKQRSELVQKALYKVSEAANSTANIQALFEAIHVIIQSLMPADNFYIALYHDERKTLSFPYFVDEIDDLPEEGEVAMGKGLTEYIIRKGIDQIIDKHKDLELRALGETNLVGVPSASWMGIVLKIDGKIIGAMVLQDYNDPKAYNEKDLELLIFISEQIAQAIERKRYSEELAKNKQLLEERANSLRQLNSTKDKFFSIIAHDLKSPFTALLGLSEYLAEDSDDLEPGEIVEYANGIYTSAKNIYGLLENLLEWSRIQTGRFEIVPTRFDLYKLTHSIVQLFHSNLNKKQIELSVKVSPEQYVYADINATSTTMRNLLSNAIKFTRVGGKVEILGVIEGTMLKIKIKDNGVGIPEETIKNLFRLDVQTSTLGTNNEKGTGIGLILCKEFVERNAGEFFVESFVGVGTTFSFTIPTM